MIGLRKPPTSSAFLIVVSVVASAALTACGGGSSDASVADQPELTPAGVAGREIAKDAGCMSCHGGSGEGGVGPGWIGIAGTSRPLDDGSEVIADRDYLVRAIADPGAQKVDGYALAMPLANLTDAQIGSIVDYIEELS